MTIWFILLLVARNKCFISEHLPRAYDGVEELGTFDCKKDKSESVVILGAIESG